MDWHNNFSNTRRVLAGGGLLALALSTAWWPYSTSLTFKSMVTNALIHGLVPTLLIWLGFFSLIYHRDIVWSLRNPRGGALAGLLFHIVSSLILFVAMWKYLAGCSDYFDVCVIPIKAHFDLQLGTFSERFRVILILVFSKLVDPVGSVIDIFSSNVKVTASGVHVEFFGWWTYLKEVATKALSVGLLVALGTALGFLEQRKREAGDTA